MTVLACTWSLAAQTRTINGTVIDEANGEPLIGASIAPIGGGNGAAADINGKFTLRVPAGVTKAKVSYVGYESKTVDLKDGMIVKLTSSAKSLDEAVVVAYGTSTKEALTGSVAVVKSKEIEKRPVTSVTSALEGLAPGVQVNNSFGIPGSSPSILIRGIGTVNGTTAPTYVVDGVIWQGSIADLNPTDVESITVLKDAASCALYGSKGANGVILITTKQAKGKGSLDVTLQIRQGIYERGIGQYDRLDYNTWNEVALVGFTNEQYYLGDGKISLQQARDNAINSFFQKSGSMNLYGTDDIHNYSAAGLFDENGKITKQMLPGYTDLDWWDAISRTGYRQEYNINASAASEKFNVFASVGYMKEQGYILKTDFERYTARMNANFNPTSYLKFGLNLFGSLQNSDYKQFGDDLNVTTNPFSYIGFNPGLPYYAHDWATGEILYDANGDPIWNTTTGYNALINNRGYILRTADNNSDAMGIDASLYGTILLPYGFDLTIRGTMHRDRTTYREYSSPKIGSAVGFGRLYHESSYFKTHNFSQTLNWAQQYGDHNVDVMLMHENFDYSNGYTYVQNKDEIFPGVLEISNFATNEYTSASYTQIRTEGYMGRVRYNYAGKYNGEFSIRRDGSSKFAKDVRWGTFWSIGANWVISRENFMQNLPWVDYLKLRAAYGETGTDAAASAYAYWAIYGKYANQYGGSTALFPTQLAANTVKWESTNTLDIALEGTLFNNRFNFSIGYFLKKSADLLYWVSMPLSAGVTWTGANFQTLQNIGDIKNSGIELSLSGDIIRNENLTWNASFDLTWIKNRIGKLPAGNQWTSNHALIEGKDRYAWYMYKWAGTDMLTGNSLYEINKHGHEFETLNTDESSPNYNKWEFDETKWNNNLTNAENAGALVEINGRYYTNQYSYASKEFIGTSLPTVYGSIGTGLSWKGINLSLLFTYSLGGTSLDGVYSDLMSPGQGAMHKDILNSWTEADAAGIDPASADRINPNINPVLNPSLNQQNNTTSSRWLVSNDYLCFKNLNLNYDLPKKWVEPLKLKGINIGLAIDNVFTATARKGMNPTYNYSGGQGEYFVTARVYSFQVTARF